jgi:cytochrome c oxidase subunit 2
MTQLPGLLLGLLAASSSGFLPERASSVAEGVDHLFAFIFWLSAFFLALIVGLTILFVVRYRVRAARPGPEASPAHSTRLEIFWSAVPLVLVMVIFAASTKVYLTMTGQEPGADPVQVKVTARKWSWWFDHPGGKGSKELHLVAGRPAELLLSSTDVIHSLYVPQFRLKQDAVPGRYTKMVLTPITAGTFPIVCAEFCGTNHSQMNATAVVHPDQASFDAWAKEGLEPALSLVDQGKKVFDDKGCSACHSADGSPGVGPSVKGLWGRTEKLKGGVRVKVDENYLRESIVKPGAKVVDDYDDIMPPIPLEEREMLAVIAYLQSLKETP